MNPRSKTVLVVAAAMAVFDLQASAQTFIGQNFTASRSDVDGLRYDASGAAGADYFVELSGGRYSVYRKSDGVRVQTSDLESFWNNAGVTPGNNRAFDPRVVYDPYAKRFYAVSGDNLITAGTLSGTANPNSFLLADSNSGDPTAGWHGLAIDSDSNDDHWADFPMIGFNKDVVTLAGNMYNVGTRTAGQSNTFVVLPKSDLLAAVPTATNAKHFEEYANTATGFTVHPAVDMDNGALPLPMLSVQPNGLGLSPNKVSGTPLSPTIITAGGAIPLNPTSVAPPTADQPGPKANIYAFDLRSSAGVVRNNGELWAVNCVNQNGRAALRWYRVNESNNTLIASGYITDASLNFMYPSIAVNDLGDVVIGMSGSDANTYVSGFAVVGKTAGGTTTFGTPFITKAGVSDYEIMVSGNNKWGDYSATTVDPADPSIFWTIQSYVHQTDARATQVTELIVPQPGEVRWKDPADGGFDANANWFGGAAPGANSHVIFSRATDPAGPGYTVNFDGADRAIDRLSVRQGKVTLQLSGSTLTASNSAAATPSIAIGEFGGAPVLNVTGGTIAGAHAIVAARTISSATVNLNAATLSLSGDLNIGGTNAAAGGDAVLNIDANSTLRVTQALRVWDRGMVNFNAGELSTGPLIVHGGKVNVASTGGAKVLRTHDVQTSAGGRVDLTSNAIAVDYNPESPSPLQSIKDQIVSASANGTWNGPGITSSAADGNQFGIGYGEAASLGAVPAYLGPLDDTTVIAAFTRYGDANLDRVVDTLDFNSLAANFGGTGKFWTQGDFNYDGTVDTLDFNFLAGNFGQQLSNSDLSSTVPEPATGAATVFAIVLAGRRRIRR